MANYAYGGLSVSVVADTRPLTSQVANASRQAGAKASQSISKQIGGGLANVGKASGKALGAVATLAGGSILAFGGAAVKAGVAYNVLYSSSLKAFKTILGTDKAATQMMTSIEKFGKTSPFPRQAFIKATQQMLAFGYSAKDVIPTLTAVQDAVAATGGSADDINGIVTILSKVKSSGKITAETLNMLGDRGVNAAELIGKGMGKSAGDIRSEITSGSLDANKALTALTQQMEIKYKGAAAGLKSTWTGSKDSIKGAMRDIGSLIVEPFISKRGGGLAIDWANKLSKSLWAIKPAVEPIVSAFMTSMQPAINGVNTGVNFLLDKVTALADPKHLPAATEAIKKFGAVGLAAFGGLGAIAGGGLLTQLPVVGPLMENLIGPVKALGAAFFGLSTPVMLIVAAIAALVALVVIASPKFRQAVMGFGKALMVALKPALDAIIAGFKMLWPVILNFGRVLGDALAPIIQKLIPLLKPLGILLGAVLKILFTQLGVAFKVLTVAIQILVPIIGWLIGILVPIVTVLVNIVAWVMRLVSAFNQWSIVSAIFGAIAAAITAGVNAIVVAWQWLASMTSAVWNVIVGVIRIAWAVIATIFTVYVIIIRAVVLAAWLLISTVTRAIWSVIGGTVIAVWNWILGVGRAVWGALVGVILTVWNVIKAAIFAALSWIRAIIFGAFIAYYTIAITVWHAISGVILAVWNSIKTVILGALNWIRAQLVAAFNFYLAIARAVWGQIAGVIGAVWGGIKNTIGGALGWIAAKIAGTWNSIFATARNVWGQIAGYIAGVWSAIKTKATSAAGDIINGMYQGFMNALKNVSQWVNAHIVQPIIKAVKDHFKIGSPSKVMAGLGGDMISGLFQGLNPGNWLKMVKTIFGGLPDALGAIVGKGLIAVEKLPKAALSALGGIVGKLGGVLGGLFGGGGKGGPTVNVKTGSYSGIMKAVLASFGIPDLYGVFMQQMMTESGGNPNAINLWDSNAKAGHPSQGLMQVIPSTFAAYAGPYRNRGILDPLANIYAAVNYAISRYGRNIRNVLGHGHGYAAGGIIREPITGVGHWTGSAYSFGERGAERVSPLLAGGLTAEESQMLGMMGRPTRSGAVINVYPREMQSETEIAAAVSRNLGWAAAGGGAQ